MDFSFENKCTIDQAIMTESVRANRRTFVILTRIPLVIIGLGILSILARAVVRAEFDLPMLLRWTIFGLLFLRIATTPRRTARRVIKNFRSLYKVETVEATTRFGDIIRYDLHGAEPSEYDYGCIRKVIAAKNCYILCFRKRVEIESMTQGKTSYVNKKGTILLTREGFTQGDFQSFRKFLAEKCPGVKIPE